MVGIRGDKTIRERKFMRKIPTRKEKRPRLGEEGRIFSLTHQAISNPKYWSTILTNISTPKGSTSSSISKRLL